VAEGAENRRKELRVVDEGLGRGATPANGLFSRRTRRFDRIERDLAEEGLMPLSWDHVLLALYEAPEHKLRVHELTRATSLVTRGGLTRLVARMEEAGLFRREPDPAEGRGLYAVPTEEGVEALRRTWPTYAHGIVEHFGEHLEEVEVLDRALRRVLTAGRKGWCRNKAARTCTGKPPSSGEGFYQVVQ
jgi:DNA-binding MarR family transcriptional regulator